MQKVFNSFLCLFFPHGSSERRDCTARVCYQPQGLISGRASCSSASAAAWESFEPFRAALILQRSCQPGRQRNPGEEGLAGKEFTQERLWVL